jgi:paired amphipathic helix protein Sin3a
MDYRAGRIDRRDVKATVNELFKGHKHLILGINNFMPKEYQIYIRPLMDDRRRQELVAFITQVKVVFKDNKEKYSEFGQVMKDYKDYKTGILSVVAMGNKLFNEHTDLLLEFSNFMPDGYQIKLPLYHDHKQGHQLVIK